MRNRDRRIESKLKKIRAFLNVAKLNQEDKEKTIKMLTSLKRHIDSDACPVSNKKLKKENDTSSLINVDTYRSKLPFQMLTDEERTEKIRLRKAAMEHPKIYLTLKDLAEEYKKRMSRVSDEDAEDVQPPLFALDLQSCILNAVEGNVSSYFPRWCKILRQSKISSIVVMVIDGVSLSEIQKHKNCFSYLTTCIPLHIEMTTPTKNGSSFENDVFKVRLSESQWLEKVRNERFSVDSQKRRREKTCVEFSDVVPKDPVDKFDRRLLLLSVVDMIQNGYPLPLIQADMNKHFKFTKNKYDKVTANSPIFAVDCEMCETSFGRELSKIAVVNEKCEVLMDRFVKPRNTIIDYSTRYSGITEDMLSNVRTRLEDIQKEFQRIIPADAILVGHSFDNDLKAMQMFHPYIIDTSVIYNLGKKNWKSGLSTLTRYFLRKHIQLGINGHSPIEDSVATLELTLLKLRKGIQFGDMLSGCTETVSNLLAPLENFQSTESPDKVDGCIKPTNDQLFQSIFDILNRNNKPSAVIGKSDIFPNSFTKNTHVIPTTDDKDCMEKALKEIKHKKFVWLNLHDCVDHEKLYKNTTHKKTKFFQLDGCIKEVVEGCPLNSLILCVFGGKMKKDKVQNAGVFVRIK